MGEDFFSQERYENYVYTYPMQIMQDYESIVELEMSEITGPQSIRILSKYREGMSMISGKLQRHLFIKKEREAYLKQLEKKKNGIFGIFHRNDSI